MIEKDIIDLKKMMEEDNCIEDHQVSNDLWKNKILKNSVNVSSTKNETCYSSCEIELFHHSDNLISNKLLILDEIRSDASIFTYKFNLIIISYALLILITVFKGSEYFNSIIGIKRYYF